jgi:hypothetical protein
MGNSENDIQTILELDLLDIASSGGLEPPSEASINMASNDHNPNPPLLLSLKPRIYAFL